MATRRFTDPKKWADPWFMALSPVAKLVYLYVIDECDNAGVWKVNRRLACIQIGTEVDWHAVQLELGDKVRELRDGSAWWVPRYVAFQCPRGFNPKVAAHLQILKLLIEHGIDPKEAGPGWDGGATPVSPGWHKEQEQDQASRDLRSRGAAKPPDVSGDTRARVEAPAPDPNDLTTPRPGDPPTARPILRVVSDLSPEIQVIDQLRFAGARIVRGQEGTWLLAVQHHGIERIIGVLNRLRESGEPAWWDPTVRAWLDGGGVRVAQPNDGWHYPPRVKFDADGPHIIEDGQRIPFRPTQKLADLKRDREAR